MTKTFAEILNDPEVHYPGNFDTPERANALLTGLCQDAAIEIERLQDEILEQCRINGMGAEREDALRAEVERLEREATSAGHTIQQLMTALEGSGTTMRSEQWYVEIEAVAAGKHHLNSIEARVREACALQVEKAGIDGYGTLAAAALIRKGETHDR